MHLSVKSNILILFQHLGEYDELISGIYSGFILWQITKYGYVTMKYNRIFIHTY